MRLGEVIALINAYCSKLGKEIALVSFVCDIEVFDKSVVLHFIDGNSEDVEIMKSDYFKE